MLQPLLTREDVATFLHISRTTLYELRSHDNFPAPFRIGGSDRWKAEDVVAYRDSPGREWEAWGAAEEQGREGRLTVQCVPRAGPAPGPRFVALCAGTGARRR